MSASWNPSVPIRLLRHLAGDGDHRHRVHVGVGQRGDQVGRARPRGGHAHPGPPGHLGVSGGRVPGALLVPDQDVPDARASRTAGRRAAGSRRPGCRTRRPRPAAPAPRPAPARRSSGCPRPAPGWAPGAGSAGGSPRGCGRAGRAGGSAAGPRRSALGPGPRAAAGRPRARLAGLGDSAVSRDAARAARSRGVGPVALPRWACQSRDRGCAAVVWSVIASFLVCGWVGDWQQKTLGAVRRTRVARG